jgi:hypothetical protein
LHESTHFVAEEKPYEKKKLQDRKLDEDKHRAPRGMREAPKVLRRNHEQEQ